MAFSGAFSVQLGDGSFQRFDACPEKIEVRTGRGGCQTRLERRLYSGDAFDFGDGRLCTGEQLFLNRGVWESADERFPFARRVQVENLPMYSVRNCGQYVVFGGLLAADSQD